MNITGFAIAIISLAMIGCGGKDAGSVSTVPSPVKTAVPAPTAMPTPKNGDYPGKGKVTKINHDLGSVELDHKEVVGLMPPMIMEFYVTDKSILKRIVVGDEVEFVLIYRDGQETISKIEKVK